MTMSFSMVLSMFVLGVFHGLEPGHGKMIVASYLVGRRGRWLDAVYLGGVVALSHSAVIIALAALSGRLAEQLRLEAVESWFELGSGVLVCLLGLLMLKNRLKGRDACCAHACCGHEHQHEEHNGVAASESGGLANARGGDAPDPARSLWGLTALGVTGGIVPCPTAIAAMLGAVSMGHVMAGTGLVVVFSLGFASVLIAVGLITIGAGSLTRPWLDNRRWTARVPLVSAILVLLLGVGLFTRCLLTERPF